MSDDRGLLVRLVDAQARTATALEALTHEVRHGFERVEKQEERITQLEHDRTRLRMIGRGALGLALALGLDRFVNLFARWM